MKIYTFFGSTKQFNKIDPDTKKWKVDKRGLRPVAIKPLSGNAPRALNVISGTTASEEVLDLSIGKCYWFQATELTEGMKGYSDAHANIRQFNYDMIAEVSVKDAIIESRLDPPTVDIVSEVNADEVPTP